MTNDQQGALAFLDNWLASTSSGETAFASLQGYAGVGKTWLTAYWLNRVRAEHPDWKIVVCAPTNKAVDVLRSKCGDLVADFRTLDSYLGFRVKRDDDWKMQRSKNGKLSSEQGGADIVVCDEGSMVKPEYHNELRLRGVRVLYVLDPAQLEPVGETIMPAAQVPDRFLMTEVVRQAAGNPIIELATFLRDCINTGRTFIMPDIRAFAPADDRRMCFTSARNVYNWADAAIDKGMDARILAFTNAAVNAHNATMHARRYPDAPLYGEGELVLVNEAFEYGTGDDEILLTNGELLRVVSCTQAPAIAGVDVYEVKAWRLAGGNADNPSILTLLVAKDPDQAFRAHRELTNAIYEARKVNDFGKADDLADQRRPLNKLAPLRHSYACTVHKSQGSTYDVALVDFGDIYRSKEMRARLLYVAATRPSQFLVMLHNA
jgi:exodeoxyribonuclease-5